ncbi:hypothetical protein BD310DRAFT_763215, partial [Dichomitus squalens]
MSRVSLPELDDDPASSGLEDHDAPDFPASSQPPEPSEDVAPSLPEPPALWDLTGETDWTTLVPAFEELRPIRLAYLHCVLANVFEHSPILDAEKRLTDELAIIKMCLGML